MSLKEYLMNLKNKIKNVEIQDKLEETSYIYPKNDEELNNILTQTINNFFPTSGRWTSHSFNKSNKTLQSNLRNNKLLAKMIQKESNLPNKYYNQVLNFISSSELFKQKVYEYEQAIIKWQINFIKNGGEGWLCDEKLGGDLCLILPNCDIAFRKGVVDTLSAIGINKEAIEVGLEQNADMWRNLYMDRAFTIKYEPPIINFLGSDDFKPLPSADLNHKQAWIKMRKYEYYCNHKRSVDLYGVVDPEMLLTQEELISLKNYLEIENARRLEFIEQYKNQSSNEKKLSLNK